MSSDDLETIFVQREALAEEVVDSIRDSVLTQSKHHALLVGPRGIGKTHLVSIVYHRIKAMEDLKDRYLIAWLREDEWGITSFLDLLLRIFRALLEERNDEILSQRVESFYELTEDIAERQAELLIKEYVADRTLIVIAENLDDIFDGLGDVGQGKLRSYIQENPFFTILATSQSLFNGVSIRTSPFYGFFLVHHLQELDFEDVVKLLTKIATLKDDQNLASFILTPTGRARVRAVHHLAGGNHRVYIIFSQFLDRKSLDDLVESVMQTLDDLTPYYQARMQWLSPQQRKIIEFLCNYRGAVAVKEIAGRSFMTQQTASSQLKALTDYGYVRSTQIGRESYYELREPLMRISSEVKKQKGSPIRLLVDFLRVWYSKSELQEQLSLIGDGKIEKPYLLEALKLAESEEDPVILACLKDLKTYMNVHDFEHGLQVTEELMAKRGGMPERVLHSLLKAHKLAMLGSPKEALNLFEETLPAIDELIGSEPDSSDKLILQAFKMIILKRYDEALEYLDKAKIESNINEVWVFRGVALNELGRHEEALDSFNKAIELEPKELLIRMSYGDTLIQLGRYDEALASFDKAIELDYDNLIAWIEKGKALSSLERYDEALQSFNKAIELDSKNVLAWCSQIEMLVNLKRYDEALESINKAIELESNNVGVLALRVRVLDETGHYEEALELLKKILEIAPEELWAIEWQGRILSKLDRYDEALGCFNKLTQLAPNNVRVWEYKLTILFQLKKPEYLDELLNVSKRLCELESEQSVWWRVRGGVLRFLKRYSEAIESLNKAIELGDKSWDIIFFRAEALLAQNHWKDGIMALDDALGQFTNAEEPRYGDTKVILENLLMDIRNQDLWSEYIKSLLDIYKKHNTLNALGQGLVGNIKTLYSPAISNSIAQTWRDIWLELAGKYDEMQIPLRLLDTAVRYRLSYSQKRKSYDQRILLELPIEERKVLEEILEPFMKEKER
jgi:tetratricopeptide (TPR) repeat protein